MTKVGAPLPRGDLASALVPYLHERTAGGIRTISSSAPNTAKRPGFGALSWAKLLPYFEQWYYLTAWKKLRWRVCALRHGRHADPVAFAQGKTGLNLFLNCAITQDTTPPALPISPCARRTWDAGASSWDYTP